MNNTLETLYALRAQMSAADLPLDAIDRRIHDEEEKASLWKKDMEEVSTSLKAFVQPIINKWCSGTADLRAQFRNKELSSLVLNLDGERIVICQGPEDSVMHDAPTRRMKEALKVVFPDGYEVFEPLASVTLGKVIERIGPGRVEPLQIQGLMSRNPNEFKACQTVGEGFYINTHSNTLAKCRQLEEISRQLGLNLTVKVVPGVYSKRGSRISQDHRNPSRPSMLSLLDELEREILNISPDFSVDKSLKSYRQFKRSSMYVANVIPRKKRLRVMLNDEYGMLKGEDGVVNAPDAHYGHMNCYYDVFDRDEIAVVVKYIVKMIRLPESSTIPSKIRIRLDKSAAD